MRKGFFLVGAMVLSSAVAVGCSGGGGGGAGGSSGSGGSVSSGGSSGSGGSVGSGGSGGSVGSGGSSSSGGSVGSGGSSSSGGSVGSGGSSGSGGGSGGGSVTTLSDSKSLGALSTTEATQLCDDTYAYFGTAIPQAASCKWKGLAYATSSSPPTEAKLRQNCSTKETACLALEPGKVWSNPGCDFPSTCSATVADYTACIKDEVSEFNQKVSGFPTCDTFTSAGTGVIWDAQGALPPGACATLGTKCPDLYPPILFTP